MLLSPSDRDAMFAIAQDGLVCQARQVRKMYLFVYTTHCLYTTCEGWVGPVLRGTRVLSTCTEGYKLGALSSEPLLLCIQVIRWTWPIGIGFISAAATYRDFCIAIFLPLSSPPPSPPQANAWAGARATHGVFSGRAYYECWVSIRTGDGGA